MMIPLTFEFHKISKYSLEMTWHRLEEVLSSSRGGQMDSLSKGTETIGNLVHPWDALTLFVCLTSAV